MYGNVVLRVPTDVESVPTDLHGLKDLVARIKAEVLAKSGEEIPVGPRQQLVRAVEAVFSSWMTDRAIKYRQLKSIDDEVGTACNIMAMVYGNRGKQSGTGVAFTRNAATGEHQLYGSFLSDAQGEDVVAGTHDAPDISAMAEALPAAHTELVELATKLERHYRDAQDIEFTVEDGHLWLLQTRAAKRTPRAAVQIAVEMHDEGLVDRDEALLLVSPVQLAQYFSSMIDPQVAKSVLHDAEIGEGTDASFGSATGSLVFHAADAEAAQAVGRSVILVRPITTPDDVGGMAAAEGILTAKGGISSHAAVVARDLGKPCVVSCRDLVINVEGRWARLGGKTLSEDAIITIDGSSGKVYAGALPLVKPERTSHFDRLLEWADEVRRLGVRANVDTPEAARIARDLGAEGVGLCRTEHMFRDKARLDVMREMILTSADHEAQAAALEKVFPLQAGDFEGILDAMAGLPVTIRLLDPPLHEFLPQAAADLQLLATSLGTTAAEIRRRVDLLEEENPMLGHRGCRLGITHPAVYDMQVRAIATATCSLRARGVDAKPEIMIPLVSTVTELARLRARAQQILDRVAEQTGQDLSDVPIGTMIEFPRACLTADAIAKEADFFSFGTNDLTQTTWGLSRDDTAQLLNTYVKEKLIPSDPFAEIDRDGVGQLMALACEKGRAVKPDLKLGICGEHGGEPRSIEFCHDLGLDYVSCSAYRVPVARLAAATANLRR
jgi:pyruvate,orthophosphate dikinase